MTATRKLLIAVLFAVSGVTLVFAVGSVISISDDYTDIPDSSSLAFAAVFLTISAAAALAGGLALKGVSLEARSSGRRAAFSGALFSLATLASLYGAIAIVELFETYSAMSDTEIAIWLVACIPTAIGATALGVRLLRG